ncbi:MAG: triose-phosphate isomerase [Candidatus Wildermuthbacteria bacterium RIFCSPLOWO2_02_FULL_47_10]|nr:MAG: triose-phosphate isomerase [Candidatus Wildermuthbacteria bacterium RIFCSPLOWO2_02_FULL_47_10]
MKRVIVVANWKCNPVTLAEAKRLFAAVKKGMEKIRVRGAEIIICPPFVYISSFKSQASSFKVGAQNCFWQESGAFTGEVSPVMLKNAGCKYVIIGHSERRRYFGETNEVINKKLRVAMDAGLRPILCVGETEEEKELGDAAAVLVAQLKEGLTGFGRKELKKIIVAYEPVWAIGNGNACGADEAMSAGVLIKRTLGELAGKKIGHNIPILYGGSVMPQNAAIYIEEAGFQGLLVGGASLDPKPFVQIVRAVRAGRH